MTIDRPSSSQLPALRQLWKQAFGDADSFLDLFYRVGFSLDRCRCVTLDKLPVAALYWFDAFWEGRKLAYLYAIATDEAHRGKGLCKALMADTHRLLKEFGYTGCLLVPAEGSLFDFYGSMGYRTVSTLREFTIQAGDTPVALTPIGAEEYAALRKKMLPSDSVLQEGDTLAFLSAQAAFYKGDGLLVIAQRDGAKLFVPELLGEAAKAPGILRALGADTGTFRTPGKEKPFAMGISLTEADLPQIYFGLALD